MPEKENFAEQCAEFAASNVDEGADALLFGAAMAGAGCSLILNAVGPKKAVEFLRLKTAELEKRNTIQ